MPGNIPFFEEHLVRVEAGYNIKEWRDMLPSDKAIEVAHKRIKGAIEAHQNDALQKKAKERARRKRR